MIILGGGVAKLVKAPELMIVKFAGLTSVLGLNANYLTNTLCGVED